MIGCSTSWEPFFSILRTDYMDGLSAYIKTSEIKAPAMDDIFRPMYDIAPEKIRVVWLGQDPYPGSGHACGRAFALSATYVGKTPMSLANILRLCERTTGSVTRDLTLQSWVDQGVFLVNAFPTLSPNASKMWEPFTGALLHYISYKYPSVVFVMLGKVAQSFIPYIAPNSKVVSAPHPASRDGSFQKSALFNELSSIVPEIKF